MPGTYRTQERGVACGGFAWEAAGGLHARAGRDTFTADLNHEPYFYEGYDKAPTAAVPENANLALMVAGLGLIGVVARRRRA